MLEKVRFFGKLEKVNSDDGRWIVSAIASDNDLDLVGDVISDEAIESMAESVRKGVPVLSSHSESFEFGKTVDGEIVDVNGKKALRVDVELDKIFPQSQRLYESLGAGRCDKQLSIGGFVPVDGFEFTRDSSGHVVRVIKRIELEHIATTRKDMAANPRTKFLSVVKSLFDVIGVSKQEPQPPMEDQQTQPDQPQDQPPDQPQQPEQEYAKIVVPYDGYPVAGKDVSWKWDESVKEETLLKIAGVSSKDEFDKLPDNVKRNSYLILASMHTLLLHPTGKEIGEETIMLLPHHLLSGDKIVMVPDGVKESMSKLSEKGDKYLSMFSEQQLKQAKEHLEEHLKEEEGSSASEQSGGQDDMQDQNAANAEQAEDVQEKTLPENKDENLDRIIDMKIKEQLVDLILNKIEEKTMKEKDKVAVKEPLEKEESKEVIDKDSSEEESKAEQIEEKQKEPETQDVEKQDVSHESEDTPKPDLEEKEVVSFKSYPLAPPDTEWRFDKRDGDALLLLGSKASSMEEFMNMDEQGQKSGWKEFKDAHTYFDPQADPDHPDVPFEKTAYALPHHRVISGRVMTVLRGVIFAASSINGARGGFRRVSSDSDRAKLYRHLESHAREFGVELPPMRPFSQIGKSDENYFQTFVEHFEKQGIDMSWFVSFEEKSEEDSEEPVVEQPVENKSSEEDSVKDEPVVAKSESSDGSEGDSGSDESVEKSTSFVSKITGILENIISKTVGSMQEEGGEKEEEKELIDLDSLSEEQVIGLIQKCSERIGRKFILYKDTAEVFEKFSSEIGELGIDDLRLLFGGILDVGRKYGLVKDMVKDRDMIDEKIRVLEDRIKKLEELQSNIEGQVSSVKEQVSAIEKSICSSNAVIKGQEPIEKEQKKETDPWKGTIFGNGIARNIIEELEL